MSASYLFEDVFEVQEANPDGKFFDKGPARSVCTDAAVGPLRTSIASPCY